MNTGLVLIGYATVIGAIVPVLLVERADWAYRAPGVALTLWYGLAASFVVALVQAAHHLTAHTEHLHVHVFGLLHWCGATPASAATHLNGADGVAAALPVAVMLLLACAFTFEVARARRFRARHVRALDLVGRRSPAFRATILDLPQPAAYCLPGRGARIVVSQGAPRLLTADQLDAVLEHERAHVAGRHHLVLAAARAFATVFGWIPLARHMREQTSLLLEMIADDRALRRHSRQVVASAMYELAAGRPPQGAFAASGPSALTRLQRVPGAGKPPHPALRASAAAMAVVLPLVPLLVSCTSSAG